MENNDMSLFFMCFPDCIPVLGAKRSVIYDLNRKDFNFIPNALYHILKDFSGKRISQVYAEVDNDSDKEIIDKYFEFLISKEYILTSKNKKDLENFPNLELNNWDSPEHITNAIIDLSSESQELNNYYRVIDDLNELGCEYLQFRIFQKESIDTYISLLELANKKEIFLELIIPFNGETFEHFLNFYMKNSMIQKIIVYGCNVDSLLTRSNEGEPFIYFTSEIIENSSHCGIVNPSFFSVSHFMFSESKTYNNCLNKKIGIDVHGNIKNCPSLSYSYGNISSDRILNIAYLIEFQNLWNINKDQLEVCNVCEFRYMCSDCRAYVSNPKEKPVKCNYDPQTCTWNN